MNLRKLPRFVGVVAIFSLLAVLAAHATTYNLTHIYNFNGNYNDGVGSIPITPWGGNLSTFGLYTFGANQGLSLPQSAFNPTSWAIEIYGEYTAENRWWKKLADFSGLASDDG